MAVVNNMQANNEQANKQTNKQANKQTRTKKMNIFDEKYLFLILSFKSSLFFFQEVFTTSKLFINLRKTSKDTSIEI